MSSRNDQSKEDFVIETVLILSNNAFTNYSFGSSFLI